MKRFLFILAGIAALIGCLQAAFTTHASVKSNRVSAIITTTISKSKINEALAFCKAQKMDTSLAFFFDVSIHSGKKRFFIVDLHTTKILASSLCCHGMGKGSTGSKPVFSNENGSYCTSSGKYKTGARAYSQWGINVHYKLNGLEKTTAMHSNVS